MESPTRSVTPRRSVDAKRSSLRGGRTAEDEIKTAQELKEEQADQASGEKGNNGVCHGYS